ncbi:hypothetical protein BN8_00230 [Fibrisoma limi BUZ 3]|uniref:Outer membrane protein beta-barrel domain-containing protein n=1 Tax=Fibrisoma limi BUZ 3 TaxID=1185876 RepID=I2GBN8_9BACT|nr:hypothetical protein [Fibrisoma limi]CCH51312.1 hypothetical protein BN8_00230 [Fibrisoma limi BUZ 3]
MRTIYKALSVALGWCLLVAGGVSAQNLDSEEDNYQTITTYGVTTNTNSGILGGFSFRQAKLLPTQLFGMKQYRYLSVELVNVKHPKEFQSNNGITGSRYIDGKQNYLFVLRPQYGREVKLFERGPDEGIAVSGIVAAGPSLGIIKPYYVQIQEGNQTRTVPYSTLATIGATPVGSGGLFQGIGQSKLTVGINVKTALSFELSTFRSNTTGIEIGFLAELFPQKIIIMPGNNPANPEEGNRSFFTSGYVTLYFGSKK